MRTTGVKLIAETSQFSRNMREAAKDTKGVNDELDKAGRSRGLDEQAKQAMQLGARIRETEASVQSLARSVAATGGDDSGLLKQLRQQQALLRQLKNVEKLLPSPAELTAGVTASMKAVVGPIGGIFAAGVAPLIGATISGAIIAGAAVGAAGIGVAIASQDQRVQAAAKRVGDSIKSQLQGAALPFVLSTVNALNQFESRFLRMNGSLERIMRNASTFLEPLVSGIADFMEPVLRGIDALVAKASPVIEAIRRGLGEVGRAIGDVFRSLADNGVEAGMAISIVFNGIAQAVRIVGAVINGLTEGFGWLIKVAEKLGFLSDDGKEKLTGLRGATDQMTGSSKAGALAQGGFKAALDATAGSTKATAVTLTGMAAATATADARIKELTQSSDDLFSSQMSLDRANLAVRNGMATLSTELNKGSRTLSLNSEEGRKNRGAVLDQLQAIESLRQTRVKHGMSLDEAGRKYLKDIDGLRNSMRQAGFTKKQIDDLTGAYGKIPKTVKTAVSSTGVQAVGRQLIALQAYQTALKQGKPVVSIRKQLSSDNADFLKYDTGGWTGPGPKMKEAGIVHADEFVIKKESRRRIERQAPGALDHMNKTGRLPGYAAGGLVAWPFPVTASMTRIPSRKEAASAVVPAIPAGGATAPFMVRVLKQAFPGLRIISTLRRGSRTLSGNRSYHADNRAVDTEPHEGAARFMYGNYKGRLKEAITPWQRWNVHNGRDRHWTGAVWRQHAFGYGNAHNHHAMKYGGTIREPVVGVGRSGATYSFGEGGVHERVTPIRGGSGSGGGSTVVINMHNTLAAGANVREAGRQIAEQLQTYLAGGGSMFIRGQQVLP